MIILCELRLRDGNLMISGLMPTGREINVALFFVILP
jgi:hypothetical protein